MLNFDYFALGVSIYFGIFGLSWLSLDGEFCEEFDFAAPNSLTSTFFELVDLWIIGLFGLIVGSFILDLLDLGVWGSFATSSPLFFIDYEIVFFMFGITFL